MLDLLLALRRVGFDEILMNRKTYKTNAVAKGMPLEFLAVRAMRRGQRFPFRDVHLPVQNVQPLDPNLRCLINDRFDWHFCSLEMPVGVCGDPKADSLFVRRCMFRTITAGFV